MIVIDVGSEPYGPERSIEPLLERFQPTRLYAIDPQATEHPDDRVTTIAAAAWLYDGAVTLDGTSGRANTLHLDGVRVPCFDFSAWLRTRPAADVVVKMDVEGAEVPLLRRLRDDGTDRLIRLLLIEWHGETVTGLRCPVEEWA